MKSKSPTLLDQAVGFLTAKATGPKINGLNLQMPGDPRYQPDDLKPFLGYDQWACWLFIVEWFWLLTLAKIGVIPERDAKLLTLKRLRLIIGWITTTMQDNREYGRDGSHGGKGTVHDIIALLELLRGCPYFPKRLHGWLHYGATSYDIISTAYALQLQQTFKRAFVPLIYEVDDVWRQRIDEFAEVVQAGQAHLQDALPVTVGFWLAGLHNRFANSANRVGELYQEVPGKFTGAVGTSAAQRTLIRSRQGEKALMNILDIPAAEVSTQIAPPEAMARFYFELVLLSGALGNLGEDCRILQSSRFNEIFTVSSRSSTMSHKRGNPIAAEQNKGMHASIIAENMKVMLTLISDLQRDLCNSSPMRSYSAVMVYSFHQLRTTRRLLNSLRVDVEQCRRNLEVNVKSMVAELLHLALQREGYPGAHAFVNEVIAPEAKAHDRDLELHMDLHVGDSDDSLSRAWGNIPRNVKTILRHPDRYIGDAVKIARKEAQNQVAIAA